MDVERTDILADVKKVYGRTVSEELRYSVEDLLLDIGDSTYAELNSAGGPVASIVIAAPAQSCIKPNGDNVAFVVKYHLQKEFNARSGWPETHIVLTDMRTGQRFTPRFTILSGWSTTVTSEKWFELTLPIDVPAGEYYVRAEFGRNGQVVSTSRRQAIAIADTRSGRRVVVR
jgi:hypothetical protein